MAPLGAGGVGWAAAGSLSPDVTLISSVIFIFLILILLALCTNCGRKTFDLANSPEAETPSTLIRVVKIGEDPGSRENPYINGITKDEKAFVPVAQHNAPPASVQPGDVWFNFTPWRTHIEILRPQDDINHRTTEGNLLRPSMATGVQMLPSGCGPIGQVTPEVAVTPCKEVGPPLQSAPPERLSHVQSAPRRTADPFNPKDGLASTHALNQASGISSNPSWPESPAPHTYESLGEVREAASRLPAPAVASVSVGVEPEDHLHNTVKSLTHWPDHQGGRPSFLTPPPSAEGEKHDLSARSLNAVYAQVNRKRKSMVRPQLAPPPPPHPPNEEEDQAPPVPKRG